ncbi:FAD-binding oxidoreductase [Nonomuraea africana]|uniref:FAD-binding oxidoreductase n=1 Tax=Nonomuraea africana TaxID=46171 RepID=UPI0033F10732
MLWSGWGDPAKARDLPDQIRTLLRDLMGVREPAEAAALDEVRLPRVTLSPAVLAELTEAVGAAQVRTDHEARVRHTRGKSTPDLMRMREGDASDAPDAVVLPAAHDEVLRVLEVCARHRVAVVPFGGGTSVVGGLAVGGPAARQGVVSLDLRRLDRLVSVDTESMVAELEPGLRAPDAERLLAEHGLTLGHFPQSYEYATLGGFAAARSSGQASAGYGRFDDMVVGLTVATPSGTLELGRAPKSAAGPDLRQLILGSEGAFGVITSLRLRVRRRPAATVYEGWRFESFQAGSGAMRRLAQEGLLPVVLRLSDETETMIGLAKPEAIGSGDSGCLLIAGHERDRDAAAAVLAEQGGAYLGAEPGQAWEHGRFAAPYLRDSLLAAGATVETLETAGFWSNLPRLYDAVRLTLHAELGSPLVMCHISHVYETGASLYFTVVTDQGLPEWERAKRAVNAAIVTADGTISHHHGVGRDHRQAYAEEIGPLGVEILRAVKQRLDPEGIMNPGVLIAVPPPSAD